MSAGTVIASVLHDLFVKAIQAATGVSIDDSEDLKAVARRAAIEAVYSGIQSGMAKLEAELAALGVKVALDELQRTLRDAEDWFKPKGDLPRILDGADITILPPDPTDG